MDISFEILPNDEFHTAYKEKTVRVDVETDEDKENVRHLISVIQQHLVSALSSRWTDGVDFEVGWDFDYSLHVCGGIYSDRIVCAAYVETIVEALAEAPGAKEWLYHTACEADTYQGEFFIRDGTVYVNGDCTSQDVRRRIGWTD